MASQINELLSSSGTLQEILQQLELGEEELLERQASLAPTALMATKDTLSLSQKAKSLSSNTMMSHNCAGGRENDSTYVDARMAGLKASKQIQSQATSRVSSLLESLGGVTIGEGSDHKAAWFDMQMRRIQNADSSDASEKNLDEIKENIERKAQEAAVPKDENGKPIEGLPTESTGEASPMPEISNSYRASTTEVAPAPGSPSEPIAVPAPALAPEVVVPAAPLTPSIDLIV